MALDYMVALATDRSVSENFRIGELDLLLRRYFCEAIATSTIDGVSVRRGLFIRVSTARSPAWGESIEGEFGFKPTVSIF